MLQVSDNGRTIVKDMVKVGSGGMIFALIKQLPYYRTGVIEDSEGKAFSNHHHHLLHHHHHLHHHYHHHHYHLHHHYHHHLHLHLHYHHHHHHYHHHYDRIIIIIIINAIKIKTENVSKELDLQRMQGSFRYTMVIFSLQNWLVTGRVQVRIRDLKVHLERIL